MCKIGKSCLVGLGPGLDSIVRPITLQAKTIPPDHADTEAGSLKTLFQNLQSFTYVG
jgi:hypothetical protein